MCMLPSFYGLLIRELRALEERIYNFRQRQPHRLLPVLALEAAYHAAGIAEVWVIIASLVGPPSLLVAFVLETGNRATNVIFKFVPMRLGVDEAQTAWLAGALGYASAAGVTLAIVRKMRVAFWTAIGVLILTLRGLRREEVVAMAIDAAARANANAAAGQRPAR